MGVRRAAAVSAARLSAVATRALGKGGGTALPGLIASRLDPSIVGELAAQLPLGSLVVSGTNGKTTTARMLSMILADGGFDPVRNESGSNLTRGLASSLVRETGLLGNIGAGERSIGLFEVDEAALPEVLGVICPRVVLLLDLFRDQLDRYGEVATVSGLWERAIQTLPLETRVVANADDPLISSVVLATRGAGTFFGLQSAQRSATDVEHAGDVKACPRCGGRISYSAVFLGHLGHYCCDNCGFARPAPSVCASDVRLQGVDGSTFQLDAEGTSESIRFPLPGMYNVYNAVAAAAAASTLGLSMSDAARSLSRVTPAFGRMELLHIEGRNVYLALAKNPAGLNEVIRTLLQSDRELHLLVMLNDNAADGRDVSWIWDADIEMMRGCVASVVFSGQRALDMALRFKYAGVIGGHAPPTWSVEADTERAFRTALKNTPPGRRLYIAPTYTAMLDVRAALARFGYVKPYWED